MKKHNVINTNDLFDEEFTLTFNIAVKYTEKKFQFEYLKSVGFIYTLALHCKRFGYLQEKTTKAAVRRYMRYDLSPEVIAEIVSSAYQSTVDPLSNNLVENK